MSGPFQIDDLALYDDDTLSLTLGLRPGSLERARKTGELMFTKRGGKVLYFGAWVRRWLAGEDVPAGEVMTCA